MALVLDLLIRGKTDAKTSLDDVMRRMYDEFYLQSPNATYYLRGRGYSIEDFQRVASEVSGLDLNDFFRRYVQGVEVLPYEEAFAFVGLKLAKTEAKEPFDAGLSIAGHVDLEPGLCERRPVGIRQQLVVFDD